MSMYYIRETCKMPSVKGSMPNCQWPVGYSPCLTDMNFNTKEETASETSIVDGIKLGLLLKGPALRNQAFQHEIMPAMLPNRPPQHPDGHCTRPGVIGHGRGGRKSSAYDHHHALSPGGLGPTLPNNVQDFRSANIWKPTCETYQPGRWQANAHADNQTVAGRESLLEYQPISSPIMPAFHGYYFQRGVKTPSEILPKEEIQGQENGQLIELNNSPPVRPILGSPHTFGPPVTSGTLGHRGGYDGTTLHRQRNTAPPRFPATHKWKQNPPTPDRTLWYHCDICECNVNSEYQFKIHTEGIKHRKRLDSMRQTSSRGPGSFPDCHSMLSPDRLYVQDHIQRNVMQISMPHQNISCYQHQIPDSNHGPIQIPNSQDPVTSSSLVSRMSSLGVVEGDCVSSMFTPRPATNRYDSDSEYFSGSDIDSVSSDIY